jgi:hypothetical protein
VSHPALPASFNLHEIANVCSALCIALQKVRTNALSGGAAFPILPVRLEFFSLPAQEANRFAGALRILW